MLLKQNLKDFYDKTGKNFRVEVLDDGKRARVLHPETGAYADFTLEEDERVVFAGMFGFTKIWGAPRAAYALAHQALLGRPAPPMKQPPATFTKERRSRR